MKFYLTEELNIFPPQKIRLTLQFMQMIIHFNGIIEEMVLPNYF